MKKLFVLLGFITSANVFAQTNIVDCKENALTTGSAAFIYTNTADKNAYRNELTSLYSKNNLQNSAQELDRYMQLYDYFDSTKNLKKTKDVNFNLRQAGYMGKESWNICFSKNKVAPTASNKCFHSGLEQEKDPTLSKLVNLSKTCSAMK